MTQSTDKALQTFTNTAKWIRTRGAAEIGQMFGKPCLKIDGKAFACFFQDEMVFKLGEPAHGKALDLKGSKPFDPSGKKQPMKEWVQVPLAHSKLWRSFAIQAMAYVSHKK